MPDKGFPANPNTRLRLAVTLAAVAGITSAIGFIEYAQLFMSFMSGNTTRFGKAVSQADWVDAARFGGVVIVFCAGAFLGTMIAAWSGRWRLVTLLGLTSALLMVGNVVGASGQAVIPVHVYPIVLAMGMLNTTLQDEAGRSLALTYVTGTVVRFGAGLANMVLHKPAPSFWIQGPLWLGLFGGAIAGGFLHHHFGEAAFFAPALVLAALSAIMFAIAVREPTSDHVISVHAPQPDAHPEAKPTVLV